MRDADAAVLTAEIQSEFERSAYPADFPLLPEVPGARYHDAGFHELEMQHIWKQSWLFAGHISQFPEHGSFTTFEKVGLSLILVRGADGAVRAFHNSCRHRGSPLVLEASGCAKRLVCPYHGWSYKADGTSLGGPGRRNFDDGQFRDLRPVRCEQWRGLIFVNLSDHAEPLAVHLRSFEPQLAEFPLERLVVKGFTSVTLNCNWKAVLDNFNEAYHVATIHKNSAARWLEADANSIRLLENGHSLIAVRRKATPRPSDGGAVPALPANTVFDEVSLGLSAFPNINTSLAREGFPWQVVWPEGPGTSRLESWLLGYDDGSGDQETNWAQRLHGIQFVLEEDAALLRQIQRPLSSGGFSGAMLGYHERVIYWHHQEIDRRIGAGHIPADLAVAPVLEPTAASGP